MKAVEARSRTQQDQAAVDDQLARVKLESSEDHPLADYHGETADSKEQNNRTGPHSSLPHFRSSGQGDELPSTAPI